MALPLGHGIVAVAIAKKTDINPAIAFVLASLPDIDFLLGLLVNDMLAFHRSPLTHSPLFAVAVAFLFWLWNKVKKRRSTKRQVIGIFLIVLSHLVLDFLVPPFPYKIDIILEKYPLYEFLSSFIITIDFIYNNLLDILIYGLLYLVVVKFIFRKPLLWKKRKK